jgi:FtsZ-interacting cell division protein YlmF
MVENEQTQTQEIAIPEPVRESAGDVMDRGRLIRAAIASHESAQRAVDFIAAELDPMRAKIDETFAGIIASAYRAHREAIAVRERHKAPLDQLREAILHEIAKVREIEKRIAQEQAAAELARERERQAEEIEAEIEQAEAAGASPEEIEEIIEQPRFSPVIVETSAPKLQGAVITDKYDVVVHNPRELFAAIGRGEVPVTYAVPDLKVLRRRAAADKVSFAVPGCRLQPKTNLGIRSKK